MVFDDVVAHVGQLIDGVGVAAIVAGVAIATGDAIDWFRRHEPDAYTQFRQRFGARSCSGWNC